MHTLTLSNKANLFLDEIAKLDINIPTFKSFNRNGNTLILAAGGGSDICMAEAIRESLVAEGVLSDSSSFVGTCRHPAYHVEMNRLQKIFNSGDKGIYKTINYSKNYYKIFYLKK